MQGGTASKGEGKHKPGMEVNLDPPNSAPDPHHKTIHWKVSHQDQKFQPKVFSEIPWGEKTMFFSVNQWRDQWGESCASLVKLLSLAFGCLQECSTHTFYMNCQNKNLEV